MRAMLFIGLVLGTLGLWLESSPAFVGQPISDAEAGRLVGGCGNYETSGTCAGASTCALSNSISIQDTGDFKALPVSCGSGCNKNQIDNCG